MKRHVTVNGQQRDLEEATTLADVVRREVQEECEYVAVAVGDEVIPRSQWDEVHPQPGDTIEIIRPIQGGGSSDAGTDDDTLAIADVSFSSRLFVGTSGYTNLEKMCRAIEASGSEMVTVGLRRVNVSHDGQADLMDHLEALDVRILPNTAGCYTADDAVTTARLGREALDTHWVKLEVIGDDETLYPDVTELLEATRRLNEEDFVVLPYTNDDPVTARKLVAAGCPAVMPLASPIGSGRGIANPDNLRIMRDMLDVPIVVDAGIGCASDAARALELGADAVLSTSAIAGAERPVQMARALRDAVRAGRQSYRAGRIPSKLYAKPTTTMDGRIRR